MKRLFVFLLLASTCFGISPAIINAHKASLHIGQETVSGESICSGTAIGPHAVLTATHCELPDDTLYIQQLGAATTIVARIRDGQDHTILLLKDATFDDYAKFGQPFEVTDDIFTIGNPGKWQDIYQKGYIAGLLEGRYFIDIQAFPGESGAGIFNPAGELVGVISGDAMQTEDGISIDLAVAYPLKFKPEDIARAQSFSAETK